VAAFTVALSTLALISTAPAHASERTTFLLSRAADGGFPNGGSRNPAVSHDQRIARVMAYESDASNIVNGDVNNTTDVFVVRRQGPWGQHGTSWSVGGTELASKGIGGAPANGPSTQPALDGDAHHAPSCVAFVSAASNLVPGDTNARPDVFVRSLSSGAITRVSVDSHGGQANGTSYDVSVDGDCEQVAFTSDSTNLGGGGGHKQVYVHFLHARGHNKRFNGQTLLASASTKGQAGNGDSWQAQFARAGKAVVFTSLASNLARGDANGVSDVYERTMKRVAKRVHHKHKQVLRFGTALVSATRAKRAGNGASSTPSVSDDGRFVAFQTLASNLLKGDRNGVSDVAEADMKGKRVEQTWVSKSKATSIGNGASGAPTISDAGEFVFFQSLATNLKPSKAVRDDANGVQDVFLWNRPSGNVSLESRDWDNGYLDAGSGSPESSSRGNYVPFVTRSKRADRRLSSLAAYGPTVDLVYLRYMGAK
jgi:Tol biopolymer transport system component